MFNCVTINSSADMAIMSKDDGEVQLWSLGDELQIRLSFRDPIHGFVHNTGFLGLTSWVPPSPYPATCACFSLDSKFALSVSKNDPYVKIFETLKGKLVKAKKWGGYIIYNSAKR